MIGLIARMTVGIEPESEPATKRITPGRWWPVAINPHAPSGATACLAALNDPEPARLDRALRGGILRLRDIIIVDDPYCTED